MSYLPPFAFVKHKYKITANADRDRTALQYRDLIELIKLLLRGVVIDETWYLAQYPDVPTVSESGLPGFLFNSWFAILTPAGTPKEIIARLNAEVLKALADPETRRKLDEQGLAVLGSSPEELRVFTRDQLAKYGKLIHDMGIAAK